MTDDEELVEDVRNAIKDLVKKLEKLDDEHVTLQVHNHISVMYILQRDFEREVKGENRN